jgi:acetolactate synthase-1/2/3 large subunit
VIQDAVSGAVQGTVSDHLARWLRASGISHVFTLPGGMIASVLDAIHREEGTEIVTLHHEQSVAFAADGFGRSTGRPAVALSTAGPGATNMLTGIADCHLDSIPAIFVTGQVQTYLQKGARPVRQFGFQECDVVTMAAPVVKRAWRIGSPREVPEVLEEARRLTTDGRPGPVLVELPADVQAMPLDAPAPSAPPSAEAPVLPDVQEVAAMLDAAAAAERPLVLLGGGVNAAGAAGPCRDLLRRLGIPAVASVMAIDVLPADDPLRLGVIGMYGNRWANLAVAESDYVLVLGSRLDFGTLGADVASWRRGRVTCQVDCDPGEMRRVDAAHAIVADLHAFCEQALPLAGERRLSASDAWRARLDELRAASPDTDEQPNCDGINPNVFVRELSRTSGAAGTFVVDAGQHVWWTCQSIQPRLGQRFMPALGLGPCGWSLPAAVGVALGSGRPVVVVVGDGALQFNVQELQTLRRHRLPIKVVVLDNGCHGSVRQLQESVFDGRYPSTVLGYSAPDFRAVAAAYGIDSATVSEPGAVADALRWLWREPASPALLHVRLPSALNVYPNVPFGAWLDVMEQAASDAPVEREVARR